MEMILETYFMHVDNTFNKLQTLCEYIDDTEVLPIASCCMPAWLGRLALSLSAQVEAARP